jgi:hypothetical protein
VVAVVLVCALAVSLGVFLTLVALVGAVTGVVVAASVTWRVLALVLLAARTVRVRF